MNPELDVCKIFHYALHFCMKYIHSYMQLYIESTVNIAVYNYTPKEYHIGTQMYK